TTTHPPDHPAPTGPHSPPNPEPSTTTSPPPANPGTPTPEAGTQGARARRGAAHQHTAGHHDRGQERRTCPAKRPPDRPPPATLSSFSPLSGATLPSPRTGDRHSSGTGVTMTSASSTRAWISAKSGDSSFTC